MYNHPVSQLGVTHPTSPGQKPRKLAFGIQPNDDHSTQLLALGKGTDTVLIKDMIKRSTKNDFISESNMLFNQPDEESTSRTLVSSNKKHR